MNEDDLLSAEQFQLYAVSSGYPQQLVGKNIALQPVTEGVYEVPVFASRIRIIRG